MAVRHLFDTLLRTAQDPHQPNMSELSAHDVMELQRSDSSLERKGTPAILRPSHDNAVAKSDGANLGWRSLMSLGRFVQTPNRT